MENSSKRLYHLLSEIDNSTDNWQLKVRVSRKWKVYDFESQRETMCVDMILIAEEGDQVLATIPKRHITKFISMLEGKVFLMSNFSVSATTNNYRPVPNENKIFFKWDTVVKPSLVYPPQLPKYRFYFVQFEDIALRYNNNIYLSDVFGMLHSLSKVKKIPSKEGKEDSVLREIILESSSGLKMKITLWGKAVDLIDDSVADLPSPTPSLVVTSSTVKKFNTISTYPQQAQLRFLSTWIFPRCHQTTVKLLEAPSSSTANLERRPFNNRRTLDDIFQIIKDDCFEGHKYTCRAKISDVIHDFEPFYYACNDCHRKVSSEGYSHWCKFCNKEGTDPIPRYKIKIQVKDRTHTSDITVFDKDVEQMLQRHVTEIIDILAMDNGSLVVKEIMKSLIGLAYVFEIKINRRKYRDKIIHALTATKVFIIDDMLESHHFPNEGGCQVSVSDSTNGFNSDTVAQRVDIYDIQEGTKDENAKGEGSQGKSPTGKKKDEATRGFDPERRSTNFKKRVNPEDPNEFVTLQRVVQRVDLSDIQEAPINERAKGESSEGKSPAGKKQEEMNTRIDPERRSKNYKRPVNTEHTNNTKKKRKGVAADDSGTSLAYSDALQQGLFTPATNILDAAANNSGEKRAKSLH